MVPITRSDPDAATAEPELDALVLVPLLLLLLLVLVLLQAVARAATATPSADARSRAVLFAFFITGSNPQDSAGDGTVTGPPSAFATGSADVAGVTQTMSGR